MGVVLRAENVSIRYITGDFKDIGLKEYTVRRLTHNYRVKEFMAVDGVSFELEEGDMLGIIGSNGAGKSTLLKAVAGIMVPTHGKITANGDIAALLELGSGFDGDLTVRENAYLRGAMLGYTREFMDKTYDQIIEFAELKEFEDRPFKQLSSGMKSRLAFSIASLVKPDILILDEVLSVGDGAFQEKSAKKMREIISQGTTTILVSHSLNQIRELCNKVLWLDHGRQVAFGETQEICDRYDQFLRGELSVQLESGKSRETEQMRNLPDTSPRGRQHWGRKVVPALVLGLFSAFIACLAVQHIADAQVSYEIIRIYSQTVGEKEVTYRGAAIGDTWYSPYDTVVNSGNWIADWEQMTYTATDATPLEVRLPRKSGRSMTFNAGPDQGAALVESEAGSTIMTFDNSEIVLLGLPHALMNSPMADEARPAILVSILVGFTAFVFALFTPRPSRKDKSLGADRETWGDLLRTICCFMIVLLHNTCGVFEEFYEGRVSALIVNSLTAFAVPCFYMISGAFLLRKPHSVRETLMCRIPKIVIPTLFWGCVYLCISGDLHFISFLKLPFKNQEPHLWFMYSLFGIYVLLPLTSKLYGSLSLKEKGYCLALLLAFPILAYDLAVFSGYNFPIPNFALFWPDLGLFVLGGFLWEIREKLRRIPKWNFAVIFAAGLSLTACGTLLLSNLSGEARKTLISCIGSIGNIAMAASVFAMVLSVENKLQAFAPRGRNMLHIFGKATMGVYLIHCVFINNLNSNRISGIPLLNGTGSMGAMILSAVVYFMLSMAVSICGMGKKGWRKVL